MSNAHSIARPSLNLRRMIPRDLPHVLQIAKNLSAGRWALKHFLKVFQSGDAVGWIEVLVQLAQAQMAAIVHLNVDRRAGIVFDVNLLEVGDPAEAVPPAASEKKAAR